MDIHTTVVYEYLNKINKKITVMQGGTRLRKTYNILIWLIIKLLNENNKVLSICRASLPTIKGTVLRDFVEILTNFGLYDKNKHNKTDSTYKLGSNLIEIISTDQPQKIKGRKRNYLYMNEANEVTLEGWTQLSVRTTEKIIIDYNPNFSEQHCIFTSVMPRIEDRTIEEKVLLADADFYVTTYRDNHFLDASTIAEIELLKYTDETLWNIYGLGQPGTFSRLNLSKF